LLVDGTANTEGGKFTFDQTTSMFTVNFLSTDLNYVGTQDAYYASSAVNQKKYIRVSIKPPTMSMDPTVPNHNYEACDDKIYPLNFGGGNYKV
jgi:hypothetical protein